MEIQSVGARYGAEREVATSRVVLMEVVSGRAPVCEDEGARSAGSCSSS